MRKYIAIFMTLASVCACTQQEMSIRKAVHQKGESISLSASTNGTATKTMMGDYYIVWAPEDSISIAHSAGTETVADNAFLYDFENDLFYGSLGGDIVGGNTYDWYASYPYVDGMTGPSGQYVFTQDRDAAITYRSDDGMPNTMMGSTVPLFGVATDVAAENTPFFTMYQGSHLLSIEILNFTGYEITLRTFSIRFTDPDGQEVPILGLFNVDWSNPENVVAEPIEGYAFGHFLIESQRQMEYYGEANFYVPIAPVVLAAGSVVTVQALFDIEGHPDLTSTVSYVMDYAKTFQSGYQKNVLFRLERSKVDNWWEEDEPDDGPYMLDGETYIVDKSDNWVIVR